MPETNDEITQDEPKWYIDENLPGPGDRPEFLPDKFKSVADMAKGYSELEKKFGQAPSEYDFSKGESWMDENYDGFKEFAQLAKERRVPQDVIDKMLEATGTYLNQFDTDYQAEMEKLGDNAKERLKKLDNWAKANLSEKTLNVLSDSLTTAEGVTAMEEIRGLFMNNESNIPNGNESTAPTQLTVKEVQEEIVNNFDKYQKDEEYRKEIERKIQKVAPTSGYKDKNIFS